MIMSLSDWLGAGKAAALTSFFAPEFFIVFLPICILGYAVMPQKFKKYYLLLASYIFYWLISGKLIAYLILSTISIHYFGLWLDRIQVKMKDSLSDKSKDEKRNIKKQYIKKQRGVVLFAVLLHIGGLIVIKYSSFILTNTNKLLTMTGNSFRFNIPAYLMPIGISFFSLQALSYILDVYHGITKADENLCRLALFLSFFPQIIEGPICRYNQTADKLWNVGQISYKNLTDGLIRITYGMMKKVVIADRLDPFVKVIFDEFENYEGGMIAIAAVCYTIQLYMDFSGTMDAVIGIAQIFGIELPENFRRPFFSKTVSEFWQRWHVSLGAWFKDYIFYPVTTSGGSKKITSFARKKIGNYYGPMISGIIALFCVWFCNGLWHGSGWNFLFFGMYHFVMIAIGNLIAPPVKALNKKLHINPEWSVYRVFQMVRTFILVVIGELFFRGNGLKCGLLMFKKMVTNFSFTTINAELLVKCNVDIYDFMIIGFVLFIVFSVSLLNEKGIQVRDSLAARNLILRWAVYYAIIMIIVIFGAYGPGYEPVDPLYAQY